VIENLIPYVTGNMVHTLPVSIDIAALEPLLQLVPTEFGDRALSILNSGMQTVNEHQTADELIWGFHDFAASAKITRHNIHAVVFECSSITNEALIEHNIQFSVEDFSMLTGEAATSEQRTARVHEYMPMMSAVNGATATAAVTGAGGQYGDDLMNALKDLDDFFNEDGEPISPSSSSQMFMGVPANSSGPTTPNQLDG
jgi:hypothetical protein